MVIRNEIQGTFVAIDDAAKTVTIRDTNGVELVLIATPITGLSLNGAVTTFGGLEVAMAAEARFNRVNNELLELKARRPAPSSVSVTWNRALSLRRLPTGESPGLHWVD